MTDIKRKIWTLIRGGSFKGYLRTASGYPLTLTDCMADKPVSLAIYGNTVQDGTPSPDNPVEVQGVGERTANLFDGKLEPGSILTTTGKNADIENRVRSVNFIPVKANTLYTISTPNPEDGASVSVRFYTSDYTYISYLAESVAILTPANCAYIRFVYIDSSNTAAKFQVEQGDTATPYEPYGYKVPVRFCGKNLFDVEKFTELVKQHDTTAYEETIEGRRCIVFTNSKLYNKDFSAAIPLAIAKQSTYTLSLYVKHIQTSSGSGGLYLGFTYNGNKTLNATETIPTATVSLMPKNYGEFRGISAAAVNNSEYSLTTFAFSYSTGAQWAIDLDSLMLAEGDTATPYEPYHEPQVYPIYLDAPLYKIGQQTDDITLDTINKKAILSKKINFLESPKVNSIVSASSTATVTRFVVTTTPRPKRGFEALCNIAQSGISPTTNKPMTIYSGSNAAVYLWVLNDVVGISSDDTDSVKVNKMNEFLTTNNAEIYYQLETPTTTDISDKIDWDSVPKLWKGTVIVTVDTTVEPSDMTATYYADKPGGGD